MGLLREKVEQTLGVLRARVKGVPVILGVQTELVTMRDEQKLDYRFPFE